MNDDLSYLNEKKYFDVNGFFRYIYQKHPECESEYITKIIMEILNDAAANYNYDDMEFIIRVACMLDIDIEEVKKFADDLMIQTPICMSS